MRKSPLFVTVMAALLLLLALQLILPDRERSDLENRRLAGPPEISLSAMADSHWADSFEKYAADQLPLRDSMISASAALKALSGRRLIGSVILGGDGRMFDRAERWNARNVALNASALQALSDLVSAPAYLLAVPTAAAVYEDRVPPGAPVGQDEKFIALAAEHAPVIPLLPELRTQRDGEALYYRTDHHWTAAGARLGYLAVCRALNLTPMAQSPLASQPGFLGSCFARCPLPWVQPDLFSYEAVPGLRLVIDGEEMPALVDPQGLAQRDAYAALLYGNHGLLELVNENVETGALIVLKDSYANALLPALARHYHRVVAIDPRYFSGNAVETIQAYEGDAVLCVYGIASLATSRALALLEGL